MLKLLRSKFTKPINKDVWDEGYLLLVNPSIAPRSKEEYDKIKEPTLNLLFGLINRPILNGRIPSLQVIRKRILEDKEEDVKMTSMNFVHSCSFFNEPSNNLWLFQFSKGETVMLNRLILVIDRTLLKTDVTERLNGSYPNEKSLTLIKKWLVMFNLSLNYIAIGERNETIIVHANCNEPFKTIDFSNLMSDFLRELK